MKRILTVLSFWALAACGAAHSEPPPPPPSSPPATEVSTPASKASPTVTDRRPMKLVLFPYIPDAAGDKYQALIRRLVSGFEEAHPHSGIELSIEIDPNMDLYDLAPGGTLNRLLGAGPEAAQIVEIDTILLGDLVAQKWVQASGMPPTDAFPAALQAASLDGVSYAVPTYLCSNVIYARSNAVQRATSGEDLVLALAKIDPKVPPLVGNFAGSWTLPSTYVDAWADSNGTANLLGAYNPKLDPNTMKDLHAVVEACEVVNGNPCLDKRYKDNTEAEKAYALGKANGFFGYTERLHYIRSAKPDSPLPSVISAPVGDGTHPIMFVDALVFNPDCSGQCLEDARAVASYMASVPVRTLIAFSQDAPPGAIPRYLLQASQGFYASAPASDDPMYRAYLPIVTKAQPYPNRGFPAVREELNNAVAKEFYDFSTSAEPRR